jgi:hypothetical protein
VKQLFQVEGRLARSQPIKSGNEELKGLESRHARLAVGAVSTLAVFLMETHDARRNRDEIRMTSTSGPTGPKADLSLEVNVFWFLAVVVEEPQYQNRDQKGSQPISDYFPGFHDLYRLLTP